MLKFEPYKQRAEDAQNKADHLRAMKSLTKDRWIPKHYCPKCKSTNDTNKMNGVPFCFKCGLVMLKNGVEPHYTKILDKEDVFRKLARGENVC